MDPLLAELLAPLYASDRYRDAERERLAAAPRSCSAVPLLAAVGCLLVRTGRYLERSGQPCLPEAPLRPMAGSRGSST